VDIEFTVTDTEKEALLLENILDQAAQTALQPRSER